MYLYSLGSFGDFLIAAMLNFSVRGIHWDSLHEVRYLRRGYVSRCAHDSPKRLVLTISPKFSKIETFTWSEGKNQK